MARRDLTGAVDFAHLERYCGGDAAIAAEVLDLFREQAAIWVRLLDADASADAWRDAAHTLKGSALGIGAFSLAEACAAAEQGAGASPEGRTVLIGRVRDCLDAVLADIAAWLHEQALQSLRSPGRSRSQTPNS